MQQAFNRSTTKYWIRTSDVSAVKRIIIENMPVFVFNAENYSGDAQLVNSVYFDNESLELYQGRLDKKPGALAIRIRWYGPNAPQLCFIERKTHRESWKGEKSVKERFTLPEAKVVPYLEGAYTVEDYEADLHAKGKSPDDVAKAAKLFREIQQAIDSKQLKPFVRTQYMRSAFQMGHDRSVSFTLDTNLVMLKENPEGHPTCSAAGRWYRDPSLPILRSEITRFPHAVLEFKLALPDGESPPEWVSDLMESGLITSSMSCSVGPSPSRGCWSSDSGSAPPDGPGARLRRGFSSPTMVASRARASIWRGSGADARMDSRMDSSSTQ